MATSHDPVLQSLAPRIDQERRGQVEIVGLAGEFDLYAAPLLEAVFARVLASSDLVVVDLTETSFFDSTVLGTLLRLRSQLRARDGRVALVVVGVEARRILRLTGLDGVFPLTSSLDAALELVRL